MDIFILVYKYINVASTSGLKICRLPNLAPFSTLSTVLFNLNKGTKKAPKNTLKE